MVSYEYFKEGNKHILSTDKGYLYFPDKKQAMKYMKDDNSSLKSKAERCVLDVKKKSSDVNPYAVCRASTGYRGRFGRSKRRHSTRSSRSKSGSL